MTKSYAALVACLLLTAAPAHAQSSGNFTYGTAGGTTACTLASNGVISGGVQCSMSCNIDPLTGVSTCTPKTGDGCIGEAKAGIKTNSGNGNVFVVRPAAVIGLLTDVTVNSKQQADINGVVSSSALAGADFSVNVEPQSGQPDPTMTPNFGVTYASRYVKISTNLFQALATQCAAIDGGCFISFNESTVSAQSFDWIASGLKAGTYGVTVNWAANLAGSGISRSLTCVGPVNLTVQQNKIFNFNSVNDF